MLKPEVIVSVAPHSWMTVWVQHPDHGLMKFFEGSTLTMDKWVALLNFLGIPTRILEASE